MPALKAVLLVFNADWSVAGGLTYLKDRISGTEPCELCAITYSGLSKKGEWKRCEKDIRAPVKEMYRNQLDGALKALLADGFPAVVAETDAGYELLIGPAALKAFERDPVQLHQALLAAIEHKGITVG